METKKIFISAVMIFGVVSAAFAMPGEYSITRGDTLWGLAGKYYNDPWKWTTIYEANKQNINDPNWIFPEQKIEIPDVVIASAALSEPPAVEKKTIEVIKPPVEPEPPVEQLAEPAKKTEPAPEPVAKPALEPVRESPASFAKTDFIDPVEKYSGDTFIVEGAFKYDGRIIGAKEQKTLIAQGDIVYIDIGANKGLKKGSHCYIFRKKGKVRTPGTNISVGTQVIRVGVLEVLGEVGQKSATARIFRSFEPIIVGDYIKIIK